MLVRVNKNIPNNKWYFHLSGELVNVANEKVCGILDGIYYVTQTNSQIEGYISDDCVTIVELREKKLKRILNEKM